MAQEPTPASITPAQSQSLYRKYRPASFDPAQLVGQEHVARTLRNAIMLDRVAHAYLFCGPRGTGKTSTARLLAKAVNCQASDPADRPCNQCDSCLAINSGSVVDIIEIDAASNRGVDDIRDLREKVRYAPTQLDVKFYIIDEAHQLTRDAFNAFLKTLEEPPPHVKFVLATTEADKLPDTVASRCQRFDFRRIPVESTLQHLRNVCEWEEIDAEEEALLLIARHATGSLRDALGLLDQLALYGEHQESKRTLTAETVRQVLGLSQNDRLIGLISAIADGDAGEGLRLITESSDEGEDVHQLNRQMIGYLRLLLHLKAGGRPPEADDVAIGLAEKFSLDRLASLVRIFTDVDAASNRSSYPQLPLELALVQAIVGDNPAPATAESVDAPDPSTAPPPQASPVPTPEIREQRAPAPPPPPQPAEPKPSTSGPKSADAKASSPPPAKKAAPTNGMLEHLVANWSHIRRDVKAENSRIAALLSSADPAAVTDTDVVLAAPYEFHRNKLNEDNVRLLIESVLREYLHSERRLVCVAPDEVPASSDSGSPSSGNEVPGTKKESPTPEYSNGKTDDVPPQASAPKPEQASQAQTGDEVSDDDPKHEADVQRIQAAKRIFEAEEVDE